METIRGRKPLEVDIHGFKERLANYNRIMLDLGTGDGRYARTFADQHPGWFVIGADSCRENLREHSQAKLKNLLFVIASAQTLPRELDGLVSHMTINFPWGSLLQSLLAGDPKLIGGIESISQANASMDVRLNAGALAEAGSALEAGAEQIFSNLRQAGWHVKSPVRMDTKTLHSFPSTWAKRLAFGRDPRAVLLSGRK